MSFSVISNGVPKSWEDFGERGLALAELLATYSSLAGSFGLRFPVVDLERRVQRALFWTDVAGVRIVRNEAARPAVGETHDFVSLIEPWLLELDTVVWRTLQEAWRAGGLSDRFRRAIQSAIPWSSNQEWNRFREAAAEGFTAALGFTAYWLLMGEESMDWRPLLDLWRIGNPPVAVGPAGDVYVICAHG